MRVTLGGAQRRPKSRLQRPASGQLWPAHALRFRNAFCDALSGYTVFVGNLVASFLFVS